MRESLNNLANDLDAGRIDLEDAAEEIRDILATPEKDEQFGVLSRRELEDLRDAVHRAERQAVALEDAVESLLNDIEAMRLREMDVPFSVGWFGGFSNSCTPADVDGVVIEWPNLALSAEEVRRALKKGEGA